MSGDNGIFELIEYNARFYSPSLHRFTQPDTIIPDMTNSQRWNRFSYAYNNPLNYTDPSGHLAVGENDGEICLPGSDCDPAQDGRGGDSNLHIDPVYSMTDTGYDFGEEKEEDTCTGWSGEYETCYHPGVDVNGIVRVPGGDDLYYTMVAAPSSGIIYYLTWDDGFGNYIILVETAENNLNNYYFLAHLADDSFQKYKEQYSNGSYVEVGTQIGNVGSTGNSTGPHLHYEIQQHPNGMLLIDASDPVGSDWTFNPLYGLRNKHKFYPRYTHQIDEYWIDPNDWPNQDWVGPNQPLP